MLYKCFVFAGNMFSLICQGIKNKNKKMKINNKMKQTVVYRYLIS